MSWRHNLDFVVIESHTCELGSARYNMDLSQRCAKSVRSYMGEQGIGVSLITTEAHGKTRPTAPNASEPNRKRNRRAAIRCRFDY
jgi:OOP family OmpA-OmpF porin